MRNIDFDPFRRTSIGFDRLFALIDETLEPEGRYPPYNILRTGEDSYRVSLAVAGFAPGSIGVTQHQNVLTVSARPAEKGDKAEYLYRGIAGRAFEKRFNLADYVEVLGATFEDGLLHIDLVRRVPEAMKPRRIAVGVNTTPGAGESVKTIEHEKAA
ncbi:Hsp20 family protein [uncultured Rhodoblastus sp.]|uniref:Hsp20 family protein n=1 Tax=uncultured Rhodoblastus sp. TaxID=543037 RepID=UPI0025CF169D|nr:Hsp20 family protein [uncultured Rhodoblastus sp.]